MFGKSMFEWVKISPTASIQFNGTPFPTVVIHLHDLKGSPDERVAAAIAELPTGNGDAVALYLRKLCMRGIPRSTADGPVARYLKWRARYPAVWIEGEYVHTETALLPLPEEITLFNMWFNRGQFPDLVMGWREAGCAICHTRTVLGAGKVLHGRWVCPDCAEDVRRLSTADTP